MYMVAEGARWNVFPIAFGNSSKKPVMESSRQRDVEVSRSVKMMRWRRREEASPIDQSINQSHGSVLRVEYYFPWYHKEITLPSVECDYNLPDRFVATWSKTV